MADHNVPIVRVSAGTAIVLGLAVGRISAPPTTAYLMTHTNSRCLGNCAFCPQAKQSQARTDLLSRVTWPSFETSRVIDALRTAFSTKIIRRVCIQLLNYADVFSDVATIVASIRLRTDVPISVSCQPFDANDIRMLKDAGANRIGIPIDAATETVFDKTKGMLAKGPYRWNRQFELLSEALSIMGKKSVSTHLIVGLGETEREMSEAIQRCHDLGILVGLFAFTPIPGSLLANSPRPSLVSYRRIQLARWVIIHEAARAGNMEFDADGRLTSFGIQDRDLLRLVNDGQPFETSGCPDCNRPFYNERPSGPIYNHPWKLTSEDIADIKHELCIR